MTIKVRLVVDGNGEIKLGYRSLLPPNFILTIEDNKIVKMEQI